uniref:Putative secreted protein n=1 Tax=Anopheles darlingi TaxID=43151 RepID=A0A2M4DIZ0_ANODA
MAEGLLFLIRELLRVGAGSTIDCGSISVVDMARLSMRSLFLSVATIAFKGGSMTQERGFSSITTLLTTVSISSSTTRGRLAVAGRSLPAASS